MRSLVAAETRLYWRASLSLRGLDRGMSQQAAWRWLSFVARSGSTGRLRRSAQGTFASLGFAGLMRGPGRSGESAGRRRAEADGATFEEGPQDARKRGRPDSEPR